MIINNEYDSESKEEDKLINESACSDNEGTLNGINRDNYREDYYKYTAVILDSLLELVSFQDKNLIIKWANRTAADSVGKSVEEIMGNHCYEVWAGGSEPCIDCPVLKSISTGDHQQHEISTPDGRIWLIKAYPVRDENGEISGAVEITQNITKDKITEYKLKHLNEVLLSIRNVDLFISKEKDRSSLIENTCRILTDNPVYFNAWIVLLNEEGKAQEIAQSGFGEDFASIRKMLESGRLPDCAKKSLEKKVPIVTIIPEDQCTGCPLSNRYIDRSAITVPLVHSDTVLGLLSISVSRKHSLGEKEQELLRQLGKEIGYSLYEIDIEEKRNTAELMLRESEKLFRTLIETLPDAVALIDIDGNFKYVSSLAPELFGVQGVDDLIGTSAFRLIAPDEEEEALNSFKLAAESDFQRGREYTVARSDGSRIFVELNVSTIKGNDGKAQDFICVLRDITDRKKSAEKLMHSQKMDMIGKLSGGIAHDFNNILTVIMGNIELLMLTLDDDNPICVELQQIRDASSRAVELTHQLLLYSRKQPLNLKSIDINNCINSVMGMLKRLIEENVELNINLEPSIWPIRADKGNIEQVIMNLVINARDAMKTGGVLDISTENVLINRKCAEADYYAREGRFVKITVKDTGKGMKTEVIDHIFEPFYSTKELGKGTGLGLSVVFGIVEEHEGWINVQSEIDIGSAFSIYLPAEDAGQPIIDSESSESIEDIRGNGELILVVEDEKMVIEVLKSFLDRGNYQLLEANSVKEAFDLFKANMDDIELVFTDTILPDGTGPSLIEMVINEKPDIRVLIGSGYTGDRIQYDTIMEKQYPFVQKPYALKELLTVIKRLLIY